MKLLFLLITTMLIGSPAFAEKLTYDQKLQVCGNVKMVVYQASEAKKVGMPMSEIVDIINTDNDTLGWIKKMFVANVSTVYEFPADVPSQLLADKSFESCFMNMDKFGN